MKHFVYPSSDFPDKAIAAIESEQSIEIYVKGRIRPKLIRSHLPHLLSTSNRSSFWSALIAQLLTIDFLIVFGNAALKSSYEVEYTRNNDLVVKFTQKIKGSETLI